MKRFLALLTAVALLFLCTACKTGQSPSADATGSEPTVPTDPGTQPTVDPESVPFTPISSAHDYFTFSGYTPPGKAGILQYLFHEPIRDTGKAYPLIIFLHGKGDSVSTQGLGTATQLVQNLIVLENASERYSAYTLVPVSPLPGDSWWSDWQLDFLKSLIFHLVDNYNIDPKRIYLTGISMGGYTTCQLVNEMPVDTFAAAVPLAGAYTMLYPFKLHNTAFRIYHAANDPVVNVSCSRRLYQQLLEYKHPKAEYFEEAYGTHLSPLYTAYNDFYFYDWLFAQRLP